MIPCHWSLRTKRFTFCMLHRSIRETHWRETSEKGNVLMSNQMQPCCGVREQTCCQMETSFLDSLLFTGKQKVIFYSQCFSSDDFFLPGQLKAQTKVCHGNRRSFQKTSAPLCYRNFVSLIFQFIYVMQYYAIIMNWQKIWLL